MIFNQRAEVRCYKRDQRGREVCRVYDRELHFQTEQFADASQRSVRVALRVLRQQLVRAQLAVRPVRRCP